MRDPIHTPVKAGARTFTPVEGHRPPYVIYHDPCPDGFGAAYSAWRYFGKHAVYVPAVHGQPLPTFEEGTDLYFVDYVPVRPLMLELAQKHREIVVIDHHIGAAKELGLAPYENGVCLPHISKHVSNVEVIFDNDHSGSFLTWTYFHGEASMPELIRYIEDRDLWRNKLHRTQEISAALNTYPFSFEVWDAVMMEPLAFNNLANEGKGILRYHNGKTEEFTRSARKAMISVFGSMEFHTVPAVNAPYFFSSDLGNRLLSVYPDAPFSASYRDEKDGSRSWSLRSEDGRVDVQQVASALGGGGHRNASGFSERYAGEKVQMSNASYDNFVEGL